MIPNGSQQYPAGIGANIGPAQGPMLQQIPQNGLHTMPEGSQYAVQNFHPQQTLPAMNNLQRPTHDNESGSAAKGGEWSGGAKSKTAKSDEQTPRKRISRACDRCNQLRTKCDGNQPCSHCVEFGLSCEYARERKKRGKVSRKEIAARQASTIQGEAQEPSPKSENDDGSDGTLNANTPQFHPGIKRKRSENELLTPHLPLPRSSGMAVQQMGHALPSSFSSLQEPGNGQSPGPGLPMPNIALHDRVVPVAMSEYGSIDDYHRSMLHPAAGVAGQNILHGGGSGSSSIHGGNMNDYGEGYYGVASPHSQQGASGSHYRVGESPMSTGILGQSPTDASPGWYSLPSPSAGLYAGTSNVTSNPALRYPVLQPLLPYIAAIIPVGLACDLLDLYFTSTSSVFIQPQSPYLLGYVFRKRSFLRQNNPRPCSPALLASMLWVAAQTSDSPFLTSPPSARGKICQKLLELTVGLLKPLVHAPPGVASAYGPSSAVSSAALGGLGDALHGQGHEIEGGAPGVSGSLDDVATYLHLATVVSASEYKAASLRWWNAAWSLARELKLGRELPQYREPEDGARLSNDPVDADGEPISAMPQRDEDSRALYEEEREERRRVWWLIYSMDRHLALCYNRPLFLLDTECADLLQPENDITWQAGEFYFGDSSHYRRQGPQIECTGHSVFGYFLPLMTILGDIVELNQARNHPRFCYTFHNSAEWNNRAQIIVQQLDVYNQSLKEFEAQNSNPSPVSESQRVPEENLLPDGVKPNEISPSNPSQQSSQRMKESILQTKIVVAYGTYLMHTLHILLNGKWDPIALLDDNDSWISSQSFVSATGHAVNGSEALNEILDYDPDLSLMPFFFGIYLLQGSFLLMLIADKLQGEASPNIVRACETIVRAHEACVVTLSTEYQRNFRKVMRSTLAQVKGRMLEDFGEQQKRRREVLALYRWTGDGTGLAL